MNNNKLISKLSESILRSPSEEEIRAKTDIYPEINDVYDLYKELKNLGIDVTIEENSLNPEIKELFIDELEDYTISYLPEREREWSFPDSETQSGWIIYEVDTGDVIIEGKNVEETKSKILDLLEREDLREEAMGGVSAPMSTLNNTPGMGNAQPASTAATTGAQQTGSNSLGSGDAWGSNLGTYTQDGSTKKKKKKKSSSKKYTTKKKKSGRKKPGSKKKTSKKNESIRIKSFGEF